MTKSSNGSCQYTWSLSMNLLTDSGIDLFEFDKIGGILTVKTSQFTYTAKKEHRVELIATNVHEKSKTFVYQTLVTVIEPERTDDGVKEEEPAKNDEIDAEESETEVP